MSNIEKIHETGENIFHATLFMHNKLVNFHTISKNCEVPQSHMRVLFMLKKYKEKTMSDMASEMEISRPNLTPIIDRLISEGYAERKEGQKDRRKLLISLTEKGWGYLGELEDKVKEQTRLKLESLPEEDLDVLNEASMKILEILKKL